MKNSKFTAPISQCCINNEALDFQLHNFPSKICRIILNRNISCWSDQYLFIPTQNDRVLLCTDNSIAQFQRNTYLLIEQSIKTDYRVAILLMEYVCQRVNNQPSQRLSSPRTW